MADHITGGIIISFDRRVAKDHCLAIQRRTGIQRLMMEENRDRHLHIPTCIAGVLAWWTNALGPQEFAEDTSAQGALPEIFSQIIAIEVGQLTFD